MRIYLSHLVEIVMHEVKGGTNKERERQKKHECDNIVEHWESSCCRKIHSFTAVVRLVYCP